MNCRQFRNQHVSFVDDLLPAIEMRAMRDHVCICDACAQIDVRIRRSLMVVRSLPQIEPSDDFLLRLNRRLQGVELVTEFVSAPPASPARFRPRFTPRTLATLAAGIVAMTLAAYHVTSRQHSTELAAAAPSTRVFVSLRQPPVPLAASGALAAVPTGMPTWSAMLAAGQLPMRFSSVDLVDQAGQR